MRCLHHRRCGTHLAAVVVALQLLCVWLVFCRSSGIVKGTPGDANATIPVAEAFGGTDVLAAAAGGSRRLASGGLSLWRAAFDYCKDPPPCVLDPTRQTDAANTDFVVSREKGPAGWVVAAGEPFVLVVRARDANADERACGGDSFQVDIRGPSLFQGYPVDLLDGTYALSVVLFDPGDYKVRVRLDYRACEGLSRCRAENVTEMVFEYIGPEEVAVLEVEPSRDGGIAAEGIRGSAAGTRGVLYGADVPFNSATYFKGRWQSTSPCRSDGDGCYVGARVNPDDGLVWRPLDNARPVLPLSSLRGQWVHSIGDSLSRNLNIDMGLLLASRGLRVVNYCVYRNVDAAELVVLANGTKELRWNRPANAPMLILERGCKSNSVAMSNAWVDWVDDATGRVFRGRYYTRFWMWHYYPDLDFTVTHQWMGYPDTPSLRGDSPPHFTFKTWAHEAFLAFVDRHKSFWSSSPSTPPAPTPTPATTDLPVTTTAVASGASPATATLAVNINSTAQDASASGSPTPDSPVVSAPDAEPQSSPVRIEVVDVAALRKLFPRDPSVVLMNKGLHHVSDDNDPHLDVEYEWHVLDFLRRAREDFPQATLLWRSTATTQWSRSALSRSHSCRTAYRVAFANERAASAIVAFNKEEAAEGRAPVRVLDYYQVSLGRPEAAPDNRHYKMDVEAPVVDELFNIIAAATEGRS